MTSGTVEVMYLRQKKKTGESGTAGLSAHMEYDNDIKNSLIEGISGKKRGNDMGNSFQNLLLVSDLDGTLIGDAFQVPERNQRALQEFKEEGGRFAIATGRALDSAARYAELTRPNAPCIVLNGTMIYDFDRRKILWEYPLPSSAGEYVEKIQRHFPEIGTEVCTEQAIHVIRENEYIQRHLSHEHIRHRSCSIDQVQGTWYKVFFAMDSRWMPEVQAFVETFPHEDVRFVPSSQNYYEMLPRHADKGVALQKLVDLLGMRRENSCAVGDYYNDVELLSAAGMAVVPANAPEEIQNMADCVVCHCRQGAVAEAIEWMTNKEKFLEGNEP